MSSHLQFLCRLYGLSLNLFPKKYREEYSEELQTVFGLSIEEAAIKGGFAVERLVLRELLSVPKAIVLEHIRERRNTKMKKSPASYFDFAYGSWKEFLVALLPFALTGGILPLLNTLGRATFASGMLGAGIVLGLFGLFLVLFLVGVKMRMPRWSLPYLGFLFAILSVYLLSALLGGPIYILFGNLLDEPSLFGDLFYGGVLWFGLLSIVVLLVILTRSSPAMQRFRRDWTLLPFVIYGAVPFALWLTFDEYAGDEPYMLLAFLVLAVGAWLYLHSHGEWNRFGVLFVAMTLAMFVATVGKAILVPTQDWPITIDAGLAEAEAKNTIMMWGWFALTMLVPLVIRFLPPSTASRQASPSEG
jgi:hypothetical protein